LFGVPPNWSSTPKVSGVTPKTTRETQVLLKKLASFAANRILSD
jgi:hypothetical protein